MLPVWIQYSICIGGPIVGLILFVWAYKKGFDRGDNKGYTDGYAQGASDGMEHGIRTGRK